MHSMRHFKTKWYYYCIEINPEQKSPYNTEYFFIDSESLTKTQEFYLISISK